jgi:hypothetical protein
MAGRDLLADEAPKGKNLLAEPKEPGFGEKAGAFAYGLGTSTLGSIGDIESMLPGGSEVGVEGKGALKGYETVFPTTKNVQTIAGKLGVPKPSEAVSGYQTAGEFAPAVVAGGKALYDIGKYTAGKLGKLMSSGKDLAQELKASTSGRIVEEAEKAGAKAKTAESRAGAAEKIAEREAGKPGAEYGQLPGVTAGTEAGVAKAIPQSLDEIGSSIKTKVDQQYNALKQTREANAQKYKAEAFNFALDKEKAGARVDQTKAFENAVNEISSAITNPDTKLAVASVDTIKNQLLQIRRALKPQYLDETTGVVRGKPVSFEGLETLRRFLRDRASGLPAEGFDAISQQQAGKLAKSVENIMSEFSDKKINKFLDQYKKDSEPLRVFQTKVGKALVDEQLVGKGANYAAVPAQSIPAKVFKSKEDFRALVDALGGDINLARQEAQKYFTAQMESRKTGEQLQAFLRDNRTMLKETGAYDMADKYAKSVIDAEKRGARATGMGEKRTATAAEQKALQDNLTRLNTDVERARDIGEINQQVVKMANLFEQNKLITVSERDQLLRQINQITDLQKKKEAVQKVVKWVLGGGTAYGAYSGATSYLKE